MYKIYAKYNNETHCMYYYVYNENEVKRCSYGICEWSIKVMAERCYLTKRSAEKLVKQLNNIKGE